MTLEKKTKCLPLRHRQCQGGKVGEWVLTLTFILTKLGARYLSTTKDNKATMIMNTEGNTWYNLLKEEIFNI